jgi:hypothetical protein
MVQFYREKFLFSLKSSGKNRGVTQVQNSNYLKIPMQDLSRFDYDEKEIDNLPEIPALNSRDNSFQQLLNQPVPALFKGSSSIIQKIVKFL